MNDTDALLDTSELGGRQQDGTVPFVENLVSIEDLNRQQIELVLDTAETFREISERAIKKVPTLRGKTIVNLFFEPSTRTRTSFEIDPTPLHLGDLVRRHGARDSKRPMRFGFRVTQYEERNLVRLARLGGLADPVHAHQHGRDLSPLELGALAGQSSHLEVAVRAPAASIEHEQHRAPRPQRR